MDEVTTTIVINQPPTIQMPTQSTATDTKECDCITSERSCDTSEADNTINTAYSRGIIASGESCVVIGVALGGMAAVLLLILVGVVVGWVWTCYRNKQPNISTHQHE